MGLFRALSIGLFILAMPVALLTTNIRFAASEHRVYDYSVRQYDAAAVSGIPEAELLRANRKLVSYLTSDDPGPLQIEVQDSAGRTVPLFNAREIAHLSDVRGLFQALFAAQLFAVGAVLILGAAILGRWSVRALARAALYGSLLTVGIIALTGLIALAGGFDAAWTQLHLFAFANDFWRLNPATDHLIQMFPESFWRDISILIGGFTLLEALLIGGAAGIYLFIIRPEAAAELAPAPQPSLPQPLEPESRPQTPAPHRRRLVR